MLVKRFLATLAVLLLSVVAVAAESPPLSGFRLLAMTDRVWIPKQPKAQDGAAKKGKKGRGPQPAVDATEVFRVVRRGKGPVDGFFEVGGKPVGPVWKSSDPSVLRVRTDQRSGDNFFLICGPGKATVSVAVGAWSGKAELTVLESPFRLGMSQREVVLNFGYASQKYKSCRGWPPEGFHSLPKFSCSVESHVWSAIANRFMERVDGSDPHAVSEYAEVWEYDRWPGCLLVLSYSKVDVILTLPAQKSDEPAPQKQQR